MKAADIGEYLVGVWPSRQRVETQHSPLRLNVPLGEFSGGFEVQPGEGRLLHPGGIHL